MINIRSSQDHIYGLAMTIGLLTTMKRFFLCFLSFFIFSSSFIAANIRSGLALEAPSGQAVIRVYAVLGKEIVAKNESFDIQLRVENKAALEEQDKSINAVDISLEFTKDMLDLQNISDGGSIVSLWIEKPREVAGEKCLTGITRCGIIRMSGLVPGGFIGDRLLANLTFAAQKEGMANLFFNQYNSRVLLNRPDAKPANVLYEPLEIKIAGESQEEGKKLILDYFPPEEFAILLNKTELALGNKWFISFSAQDKGSGIDYYEVKENFLGFFGEWQKEDSPYELAHQSLLSVIEVRAVDKVGQVRTEILVPERFVASVAVMAASIIFAIAFFGAPFLKKIKRLRKPVLSRLVSEDSGSGQ